MALHLDENGVGAVTPNYLFSANGTVAHPLQRAGVLPHLPSVAQANPYVGQTGHPWIGSDRSQTVIGSLFNRVFG